MENPYQYLYERLNSIENSLQLLAGQLKTAPPKECETMSIEEVAKLLNRTVDTVYYYTHKKTIPHYKPNGTIVIFFRKEIMEWITSAKVKTADESKSEIQNEVDAYLQGRLKKTTA